MTENVLQNTTASRPLTRYGCSMLTKCVRILSPPHDAPLTQIISAIERRISHISFLPVENGEGIQILHYVDGEKYDPHHDFFHDNINTRPEDGGQRIATVLMYL